MYRNSAFFILQHTSSNKEHETSDSAEKGDTKELLYSRLLTHSCGALIADVAMPPELNFSAMKSLN